MTGHEQPSTGQHGTGQHDTGQHGTRHGGGTRHDEPAAPPTPGQTRAEKLRAYHEALNAPEIRSDDPMVRAKALVAFDDARAAYRNAGGNPGSRWSTSYAEEILNARELLGENVDTRREALRAAAEEQTH